MGLGELRLPKNLKVHFAGTEKVPFAMVCEDANIKYTLYTCYGFLAPMFGIPAFPNIPKLREDTNVLREITQPFNHTIMDSGLFTLMFGSQRGVKDKDFIEAWYQAIVDFVRSKDIKSTIVEVDCQKVLGVEEAWELRERMKKDLPHNRQINVFHLVDGEDGLNKLIAFSDYLAISVPEWRIHRRRTYSKEIPNLLHYIKRRKPEIDIHLLGCTEQGLLRKCRHLATSSDSTSYMFPPIHRRFRNRNFSNLSAEYAVAVRNKGETIAKRLEPLVFKPPISESMKKWLGEFELSARFHREYYSFLCGSQE